jgi:hypothetical protein
MSAEVDNIRRCAKRLARDLGVKLTVAQKTRSAMWRAFIDGDGGKRDDGRTTELGAWYVALARVSAVAFERCSAIDKARRHAAGTEWELNDAREATEQAQERLREATEADAAARTALASVLATATPEAHKASEALAKAMR